ncbi:hypothetical protein CHS0354_017639, partial [Potamilus streckersoni]
MRRILADNTRKCERGRFQERFLWTSTDHCYFVGGCAINSDLFFSYRYDKLDPFVGRSSLLQLFPCFRNNL